MNFIDLFGSDVSDIKIQVDYIDTEHRDPYIVTTFTASPVHTGEEYSIKVGTNEYTDKYGRTFFNLNVYDDESEAKKEIEFEMHGGAEREILIGLLKSAVAVLEGNELGFVPQKCESEV